MTLVSQFLQGTCSVTELYCTQGSHILCFPTIKSSVTILLVETINNCFFAEICFLCGSPGKESACNAGDMGSVPGLGRSPGEGKAYPL